MSLPRPSSTVMFGCKGVLQYRSYKELNRQCSFTSVLVLNASRAVFVTQTVTATVAARSIRRPIYS